MSFFMCVVMVGPVYAETPISIPDPILKEAIENNLQVLDPTPTDMLDLISFSHPGDEIRSLTGLSYATNLRSLHVGHNEIGSISPVAGLRNLTKLVVNNNRLTSISAVRGLTKLTHLDFHDNFELDNISAVRGLYNLSTLVMRGIAITDISALSDLPLLSYVDLEEVPISDISILADRTNLHGLVLHKNLHLNDHAYCVDLHAIVANNPDISLRYSPNSAPPSNVSATQGVYGEKIRIIWDDVCAGPYYQHYYQVLRGIDSEGARTPISRWTTQLSFDDATAEPDVEYTYWVHKATAPDGANTSVAIASSRGWLSDQADLTVNSAPGGQVILPGAGRYQYEPGTTIDIVAEVMDPTHYFFTGWTGTAVERGLVADPSSLATTITMNSSATLTATWATNLNRLYVDRQAATTSLQTGTYHQPFDAIQEAIDAARNGMTVVVRPGLYPESIQFLGKEITLTGINPDDPSTVNPYPVIEGSVRFINAEGPQAILTGFVITQGQVAIHCLGSSPTIRNCLIVGNQSQDRGTIDCRQSQPVISNCTIADNQGYGLALVDSEVLLENSILWDNSPEDLRVDQNSLWVIRYCDLSQPVPDDPTNLSVFPVFANSGSWQAGQWIAGDYHLASKEGRWDPLSRQWLIDSKSSPGLDTGDPAASVGSEPLPNGAVINMGAYGGTLQASLHDPESIYTSAPIPVYFVSLPLKAAVEEALGLLNPTPREMRTLTSLSAGYLTIKDLSGLEYAINLESLKLHANRISDLSPLQNLEKLRVLKLQTNDIRDISPLLALRNLQQLDLRDNPLNTEAMASHLESLYTGIQGLSISYSPTTKAPRNVEASNGEYPNKVKVTWDDVPNGHLYSTYFRVSRSEPPHTDVKAISSWRTSNSYTDNSVVPGVRYKYRVQSASDRQGSDSGSYSSSNSGWAEN